MRNLLKACIVYFFMATVEILEDRKAQYTIVIDQNTAMGLLWWEQWTQLCSPKSPPVAVVFIVCKACSSHCWHYHFSTAFCKVTTFRCKQRVWWQRRSNKRTSLKWSSLEITSESCDESCNNVRPPLIDTFKEVESKKVTSLIALMSTND